MAIEDRYSEDLWNNLKEGRQYTTHFFQTLHNIRFSKDKNCALLNSKSENPYIKYFANRRLNDKQ